MTVPETLGLPLGVTLLGLFVIETKTVKMNFTYYS